MKKRRVLFLIHDLGHGGAEKVLLNLVNHMDSSKFEITVFSLFDEGVNRQFLAEHIQYCFAFRKIFRGNTYFLKLFSPKFLHKYFIKESYDIEVAYLEGSCTRIIGGCLDPKVKKVAWRHSAETQEEFVRAYFSANEAHSIYERFDKIVGVSDDVSDNFKKLSGITDRVVTLYNTNETEKIQSQALEHVDDERFEYTGIKLCGVAKIRPRKGFARLARVHVQLMKEGLEHRIFILGEGEEQGKIERYLKENKADKSFVFLGYDTNPYKYVAKCDLFVCPSFEEGFSTAATEALVVGTPVLTTLCSGMKEMLGAQNEYGVIVNNSEEGLYQGMKELLLNPEKIDEYKKKAGIRGEYFSMEKTVRAVEEMLETLC